MNHGIGILGIGVFLPPEVRSNSWWPASVVDGWRRHDREQRSRHAAPDTTTMSQGGRLALAGMAELADDPFSGSRERRVAAPDVEASDMSVAAAREAVANAGLKLEDIDLLLDWALVPDLLNAPNACVVHHKLGLSPRCFTTSIEAACNAFQLQVSFAEKMIRGGQARYALLVSANNPSRITPPGEPISTVFGDGATAVVLGPVSEGFGLLAQSHRTNSAFRSSLGTSMPGRHWWEDGRPILHAPERAMAFRMLLEVADFSREVVQEAVANAGFTGNDVDFFACHQGAAWLRRAAQECTGLPRARSVDTFAWTCNLSAANLPLVMSIGEKEGLLRRGDLVATFSGGTGVTYSSLVLRWGR